MALTRRSFVVAAFVAFARTIISDLVDQEALIATAKQYKIEVTDADVLQQVEGEMKRIHDQFKTEQEYRDALKAEGFGTVEELRKIRTERAKRDLFQQRAIDSLKAKAKAEGSTCVECHFGIAHKEPEGPGPQEMKASLTK